MEEYTNKAHHHKTGRPVKDTVTTLLSHVTREVLGTLVYTSIVLTTNESKKIFPFHICCVKKLASGGGKFSTQVLEEKVDIWAWWCRKWLLLYYCCSTGNPHKTSLHMMAWLVAAAGNRHGKKLSWQPDPINAKYATNRSIHKTFSWPTTPGF